MITRFTALSSLVSLIVLSAAAAGQAQSGADNGTVRDLCPDRPGLNTPACTVDSGRVQMELSLADWARSREGNVRSDDLAFGDLLVRIQCRQ